MYYQGKSSGKISPEDISQKYFVIDARTLIFPRQKFEIFLKV
jgi:hypothetical protein